MRYVIKNPGEGFFTEMKIVKTRAVTLNGRVMGHENDYAPMFEAMKPSQATQFDTEADASSIMKDEQYGGASAFVNCTIEPSGV